MLLTGWIMVKGSWSARDSVEFDTPLPYLLQSSEKPTQILVLSEARNATFFSSKLERPLMKFLVLKNKGLKYQSEVPNNFTYQGHY